MLQPAVIGSDCYLLPLSHFARLRTDITARSLLHWLLASFTVSWHSTFITGRHVSFQTAPASVVNITACVRLL